MKYFSPLRSNQSALELVFSRIRSYSCHKNIDANFGHTHRLSRLRLDSNMYVAVRSKCEMTHDVAHQDMIQVRGNSKRRNLNKQEVRRTAPDQFKFEAALARSVSTAITIDSSTAHSPATPTVTNPVSTSDAVVTSKTPLTFRSHMLRWSGYEILQQILLKSNGPCRILPHIRSALQESMVAQSKALVGSVDWFQQYMMDDASIRALNTGLKRILMAIVDVLIGRFRGNRG